MRPRNQKTIRIQDSVHGIIELSPLETYVVDSLPFQRLLNVKQLGMAYSVFPGADYSRFAHCIGVCDQMGRWMDALTKNGIEIDEPKKRLYRLAALLHDVGHYPFSHTLEHAVEHYYKGVAQHEGVLTQLYLSHEAIGEAIVERDNELNTTLVEIGLNLETLQKIFSHDDVTRLSGLLSSDLDADRVDYLRRTAHHTGLPYGLDDIQYLTTELRRDNEGRPCWTERALHALDHLLLARFFDYQQVVYNKTVVGLELVLERLVEAMLRTGELALSSTDVVAMLRNEKWIDLDDHLLFQKIKEFRDCCSDRELTMLCNCLLKRNPPRAVYDVQFIGESSERPRFKAWAQAINAALPGWAAKFDLDPRRFFAWVKPFAWTSYDLDSEVSHADAELPELLKLPRVLRGTAAGAKSVPLVCHPSSVIQALYLRRAYSVRIYVVLESDEEFARRTEISQYVAERADAMRKELMTWSAQTSIFDVMGG